MNHYRILKQGEMILDGDEYLEEMSNVWHPRQQVNCDEDFSVFGNGGYHAPHRRKLAYPEHTPPAPPEGMRWEYRGRSWFNQRKITTFYGVTENGEVDGKPSTCDPAGFQHIHYFEAVPDADVEKFYEKMDQVADTVRQVLAENPKESAGRKKCPMHLLSPSAMRETANALGHGAAKYKARNYRTAGVNATTYVGAILRHITAWNDGEDLDPESGLSHIAHVAACADILLDTMACGMMNDDRSKKS